MEGHERRRARRIPVGLKVEFDSGYGLSRDVSGLGLYFETASSGFHKGDQISFAMVIPEAVNVDCKGEVVRVDELGEELFGVACTIESFDVAEDESDIESAHIVIRELKQHH